MCIEAKKVFDFCFQEHRVERNFNEFEFPDNKRVKVECEIDEQNISCREVGHRKHVEGKKGKFLVCVAIEVPVRIRAVDEFDCEKVCRTFNQKVVFLKQAVLCAPEGTEVECEVTGNCCCFFDRESRAVSCVFDFCVVIQAKANVKILVPTLGLCAPAQCKTTATGCPPRVPKECDRDCDD
jgi:hypothetical protein